MIKYSIRGENLEVTEAIRDYVVSKLEKIENTSKQIKNQMQRKFESNEKRLLRQK